MHEASLMRDLISKVLEIATQKEAKRILHIRVRLGALSHMSPGHFQEHFDQASSGTIAEGARVEAIEETDIHSPTAADVVLESIEVS